MSKVILISQMALPFSSIGSWPTLYKNYLQGHHLIDFIVCSEPEEKWDSVKYSFVKNDFKTRLQKKWKKNPYLSYFNALEKLLKTDEKYIIQIVDNYGVVKPLFKFLDKKGLRQNCYLQFFYHGFPPHFENFQGRWFFEAIDEMVLLTYDSYLAHKNYYTILPTRFTVLHNGIDTAKFFPLSQKNKQVLKLNKGVADKKVFVWCSQDRPKKGLHILLDAWERVYSTRQDIVLWVIGCEPKKPQDGVDYLGRIPNEQLATYLQTADCYLFPTLCHEGFGLSLLEALHCGNYCIASAIGGVPELLQYGKLGKLIENFHFISEWEQAIIEFMVMPNEFETIPQDLYTANSWNLGMNEIIKNAKNILK
ncbi:glycosyltransferase family 4 protein [Flavobacterium gilvum]|uniref:Glycosyl transferase family 1 n=1 Tax=Flavobacterium gilvum TaxID=1492737 RepID=A0AAC9N5X1_9FLAO|nr:glycosyltransferase family 4 protein [Flavobacterium gilvum]AOW08128.1 glycosyl transferase family 1 [Flavobacterium gilvum]KFC58912.1 glycosyl transferase family 1 [Flavobacterium gilvum]